MNKEQRIENEDIKASSSGRLEELICFPAEWAEQEFIQLTFPHEDTDWNYILDEVNVCFVNIATEIAKRERLLVVCRNIDETKNVLQNVDLTNIRFVELPSNDTWARDHGGITVFINGQKTIYDFGFNGWGLKFAANHDNQITPSLFEKGVFGDAAYKRFHHFILEGGSIESDGKGTLLTTAHCLEAENRNDLSEQELEKELIKLFGLERVLWLHHGYLAGDDTDSHIDTLARFCTEDTIAYVHCDDKNDEHFEELNKMRKELEAFRTSEGKPYRLAALPMADAVYDENGERLPATYANFLIINGAVFVPAYNSPKDDIACELLKPIFPDREIVKVDCTALIKQHGSLHCVTMQYPL